VELCVTRVTVLYFGGLRDALACSHEVVELSEGTPSLAALYAELCNRQTRLPMLMASVRLAVNEEFVAGMGYSAARADQVLSDGDVVAFIPPVTGG
jgi:sulfur-carrier protein